MPEGTEPGTAAQGDGGTTAADDKSDKPEKTFTQAELDAILERRLKRAVPDDYEDAKAKAAKFDEIELAKKTETERAQAEKAAAEKKAADTIAKANATLRRAAILAEASEQNAVDRDTVVALLQGDDSITVTDEGEVKGVKDAVKKLLKDKPFLVKTATDTNRNGGEFGANDAGSIDERIAALERAGKWTEARDLKLQKGLSLT